jgi:hypothetical protein
MNLFSLAKRDALPCPVLPPSACGSAAAPGTHGHMTRLDDLRLISQELPDPAHRNRRMPSSGPVIAPP